MIKDKTKEVYTSPQTEVLMLEYEGLICESTGDTSIPGWGDGKDFPIGF